MAATLLQPTDAESAAAWLERLRRERQTVAPRGSGSKLAWIRRSAPLADVEMSVAGIRTPLAHYAGDLVATVPAGLTLTEANAELAKEGQWLPLDPLFPGRATIGGIVATNDSGPRRHRYGAPRDLIIGIEVALTSGRLAHAGGRVVKNVAGYDLSRLFCGSFGSLGVITSATFKLAPLTAASRTVVGEVADPRRAVELALAVAAQPVTPSAMEFEAPGARLLVRFESTERAAEHMAAATKGVLREGGARTYVLADEEERAVWESHGERVWTDHERLVVKISALPTDLAAVFVALDESDRTIKWDAIGRAALGVIYLALDGPGESLSQTVQRLQTTLERRRGTMTVLTGAEKLPAAPASAASALSTLMQNVKQQFDPERTLPAVPAPSP